MDTSCGPDLRVVEPPDERQRYIIDMMASYVLKDGCDLEQVLPKHKALEFWQYHLESWLYHMK